MAEGGGRRSRWSASRSRVQRVVGEEVAVRARSSSIAGGAGRGGHGGHDRPPRARCAPIRSSGRRTAPRTSRRAAPRGTRAARAPCRAPSAAEPRTTSTVGQRPGDAVACGEFVDERRDRPHLAVVALADRGLQGGSCEACVQNSTSSGVHAGSPRPRTTRWRAIARRLASKESCERTISAYGGRARRCGGRARRGRARPCRRGSASRRPPSCSPPRRRSRRATPGGSRAARTPRARRPGGRRASAPAARDRVSASVRPSGPSYRRY